MFHAERDGKDCDSILLLPGGAKFFGEFFRTEHRTVHCVLPFLLGGAFLRCLGHPWHIEVAGQS